MTLRFGGKKRRSPGDCSEKRQGHGMPKVRQKRTFVEAAVRTITPRRRWRGQLES